MTSTQGSGSPSTADTNSRPDKSSSDVEERWRVFWVFLEWCIQRESLRLWNYAILLVPVLTSGYFIRNLLFRAFPAQGPALLESLLLISAFFIFTGGVIHASKAVCWEVSRELRDLVRLTGIEPSTLLWCQSLSRWWTIALSIILILPLAMYARTMGAISAERWFAGLCWLLLVTILSAGFAVFASVTSNRANNAETAAATGTFLLMLVYHIFFWGMSAMIGLTAWYLNGKSVPTVGSIGDQAAILPLSFTPVVGVYRGLKSPGTFSPLDPTFFLHFFTAFLFMWAATVVIRNRLRVTTQGDERLTEPGIVPRIVIKHNWLRPRCGDRPFFWKDTYILGTGRWTQVWWTILCALGLLALIGSTLRNVNSFDAIPLVLGISTVSVWPCVIAARFDALLTAEFRGNTWNSLMLLPIDPRTPIIAKIQAAAWERKAMFVPVVAGAAIASFSNVTAVMMAATISLLMGILMIEVSILNQFYLKSWWVGPITGFAVVMMIMVIAVIWVAYGVASGFVFTCLALGLFNFCVYLHIAWRLEHWTEI
ncbi:MAG: hypothetical protein WCH39_02900 [Schlesneria sp.]